MMKQKKTPAQVGKAEDPAKPIIDLVEGLKRTIGQKIGWFRELAGHIPSPEIVGKSIENLIKDAERTVLSADSYIKTICYVGKDEKKIHELRTLVETTASAALLVFDKRYLEIIETAVAEKLITSADGDKMTAAYLEETKPKGVGTTAAEASSAGASADAVTTSGVIADIQRQLVDIGNPYRPCFSQTNAEHIFGDTANTFTASEFIIGKSVRAIGDDIRCGRLSKELINVGVFFHDHVWVCQNNRSLMAASISGVEPRLEVVFPTIEFVKYYDDKKKAVVSQVGEAPKRVKEDMVRELLAREMFSITPENKSDKGPRLASVSVPMAWTLAPSLAERATAQSRLYKGHMQKVSREPEELLKEQPPQPNDDAAASISSIPTPSS